MARTMARASCARASASGTRAGRSMMRRSMMRRSMMGRARAFEDGADAEGVFDALFEESAATNSSVDDGHPRAAEVASDDPDDLLAAADASPYFNDAFREALAGAQKRMGEERRAEMEKIDEEVAVIMQRVRAERAMNAESAKKPEASEAPSATPAEEKEEARIDAEEEKTREPTPEPVFDDPPAMNAEMTDVLERELLEMHAETRRSVEALEDARAKVDASLANEKRQLSRLEMLLDRVRREARYSRAERAVRKKKE